MFAKIEKRDYYENMYDIESLTNLNRQSGKIKNEKNVSRIEGLIRKNKCRAAKKDLREITTSKDNLKKDSRLQILGGALWIKDRVFHEFISRDIENISPKNCALKELSLYLKKTEGEIEKKMLVEKPVVEAWNKINPNPKNSREIDNFYISTDAYIFELMAANHIVQTLYSYFVLTDKLQLLGTRKILDYGAGAGTLSILFHNLGYRVTYADLPGKLFDFAKWRFAKRKMNIPMVNLKKGRANKVFDCILCTEVIEHVVDPVGLLKLFRALLQKGDLLVVSESCEYTEDFSSHLEGNKKYGGEKFIKLLSELGFRQIYPEPFIPQMIFQKE
jgi:2-polyprenyl-3-methyl-5-hydroxy-6-metoxy-1,4-benzoquinol methylase